MGRATTAFGVPYTTVILDVVVLAYADVVLRRTCSCGPGTAGSRKVPHGVVRGNVRTSKRAIKSNRVRSAALLIDADGSVANAK